jgi:hypothetical protein
MRRIRMSVRVSAGITRRCGRAADELQTIDAV